MGAVGLDWFVLMIKMYWGLVSVMFGVMGLVGVFVVDMGF